MQNLSPIQSATLCSIGGVVSPTGYAIAAHQTLDKADHYGQPLSPASPLANGELPTVANLPVEILEELVDALAYAHLLATLGGPDVIGPIIAAIAVVDKALVE